MDRVTTIVILVAASLLVLVIVYLILLAKGADTTTQVGVMAIAVGVVALLATYFVAALPERKEPPSSARPGRTAEPSPSSTSRTADPKSSPAETSQTPKPENKSSNTNDASSEHSKAPDEWQNIRATKGSYKGLCMEATESAIVTAPCSDKKEQQWKLSRRGEIVNHGGRCMAPEKNGGGATMLAQACEQSDPQVWEFQEGRVWSGVLCLTIRGPSTAPSADIQTWDTVEKPEPADEMYWTLSE